MLAELGSYCLLDDVGKKKGVENLGGHRLGDLALNVEFFRTG